MERDPAVHQTISPSATTSASSQSAALRSVLLDGVLLNLAMIIAVLSFAKNYGLKLNQTWGDPYFFLNYSDGFIKRGLMGQVFSTIYPGASPEATRAVA